MRIASFLLLTIVGAGLHAQKIPVQSGDQTKAGDPCKGRSITVRPDGTTVVTKPDCSKEYVVAKPESPLEKLPKAQTSASTAAAPSSSTKATRTVKPQEPKPEELPEGEFDPGLRTRYIAATGAYYDYFASGYLHREQVFKWQLISSKIIFVLVIVLVLSGVYFAAIQFHEGVRNRATLLARTVSAEDAAVRAKLLPDDSATTFSASSTGFSVSSPVLGVIVLVISLAFFYLYLVYIYPIAEIL